MRRLRCGLHPLGHRVRYGGDRVRKAARAAVAAAAAVLGARARRGATPAPRWLCADRAIGRGGLGDGRVRELAAVHKLLCICAATGRLLTLRHRWPCHKSPSACQQQMSMPQQPERMQATDTKPQEPERMQATDAGQMAPLSADLTVS